MQRTHSCVAAALFAALFSTSAAQAAVIDVRHGGDLQAALDRAQPGDTIVLAAGSRFVGQFRFPAKTGTVTLTSSGPLPSRRISEADAPLLATVASGVGAMAFDLTESRHWTIDGIRFEPNVGGYGEIIAMTRAEHIVLRRLLLVVPPDQQQKRFVMGNGRHITLTQSHCGGVWREGQDSQCFAAWDGAGPYTIRDNFLEAASENVMFGGADSTSADTLPSDILVEHNLLSKRLEWKGQRRGVKNLFELKAARRVVVRHNVFERNWVDAQGGTAILFTPRNQEGAAPWTVVEDVLFEYNVVRDTPAHFNILGYDGNGASGQTTRITIRHNLLLGTGGGRLALIGNEVGTVTFDHNTYVSPQTGESSMVTLYAEGEILQSNGRPRTPVFAAAHLTFTNNMAQHNTYGLHSSAGIGTAALNAMTQGYSWANNVLAGGSGRYPAPTTFLPAEDYPAQFDAEYYLAQSSPFRSMATDGTDIGWNRAPAPNPDPDPDPEPRPVAITTTSVPNGRLTLAYSVVLTASGGSGTFTWRLEDGTLPAGLTLDPATGRIAGTPQSTGTSTFTVSATDGADPSKRAAATYTIEVTPPVSIASTTLPGALRGRAYSATFVAQHAVGALRWTVASGALPAGLSLDPSSGVLSGKPRDGGAYTFTVAVADSNTQGTRSFTLQVANR